MWGKRKPDDEPTPDAALRQPNPADEQVVEAATVTSSSLPASSIADSAALIATPSAQSTGLVRDISEASTHSTLLIRENTAQTTSGDVRWSSLRFIAQLRQTFLLCEGPVGIYVLDQHAAAERVAYQRLLDQYRSRTMAAQTLLFPVSVELSPEQVELVEQRSEEIAAVGLDVRVRGRQQVTVHAIPRLLQRASPERLLCDLVGEMARSGGRGFSAALEHALSLMACHGSLRAGDTISQTEAQALLGALDTVDFAGHCAHGRPVVAVMSYNELERKVGRR
jgi:DNA mismatch repair protein MutL